MKVTPNQLKMTQYIKGRELEEMAPAHVDLGKNIKNAVVLYKENIK